MSVLFFVVKDHFELLVGEPDADFINIIQKILEYQ
jgi:hypothetical protein